VTQPQTPFDAIGGHDAIHRVVNRFYDLMDADPAYAELRAMHAADLGPMRQSLAGWLAAWAGGPRDWFEANPGKCVMSAHAGIGVTSKTARQWTEAMGRALADGELADAELGRLIAERFTLMANAMAAD